ncbi:DUF7269 family protein [Natrinema gari]|uniref:Uncharacterized protein n=1 Tax=Natrinema gari JCM 14663 TaxID=1230459 RepID=L9YVB8_9EURY|nr:hypothetical protein [Natrinema gari]ELY78044.1 hypothetical protein C486_14292 [Natrinema gari JCM 14663]
MSRRSSPGPWRRLLGQLEAIHPEVIAVGIVGAGAALAVGAVVFAGFLPPVQTLTVLLYPFAALFPAIGAVLAVGACWWIRTADRSDSSQLLAGPPPEAATTATEHPVGRETARTLRAAGAGRYRCRRNESAATVRRRLVDGAVRVVTTKRGLAADAAREAVRTGTWTDDPVAAAFLAENLPQPPRERLRAAVDPGAAYHRRVRRTLAAIERIDDGTARNEEVDR